MDLVAADELEAMRNDALIEQRRELAARADPTLRSRMAANRLRHYPCALECTASSLRLFLRCRLGRCGFIENRL